MLWELRMVGAPVIKHVYKEKLEQDIDPLDWFQVAFPIINKEDENGP